MQMMIYNIIRKYYFLSMKNTAFFVLFSYFSFEFKV